MMRLLSLVAAVSACKTKSDCAQYNMTLPTCVEQTTGDYSQCIDCSPAAFQLACKSWTKDLLVPAEAACSLKCSGAPPSPAPVPKLACHKDADCAGTPATPKCVVQDDGQYAQCISCEEKAFDRACPCIAAAT